MAGSHERFLRISNATVSGRGWYLSTIPDKPKFVRKGGKSPKLDILWNTQLNPART